MDRYDRLILEIIQQFKEQNEMRERIRLRNLERKFWKEIERDKSMTVGQGKIGERITHLYLEGLIENKSGYTLTRKGKLHLQH